MLNVRLAGDHLFGKLLFTWLSLVMSMMVSFVLSFFPRDVLDDILSLIGSVSEGFPSYSFIMHSVWSTGNSVVKRWPADLVVSSLRPVVGGILPSVNGVPLHKSFHYHRFIVLIWLKYCWEGRKNFSQQSIQEMRTEPTGPSESKGFTMHQSIFTICPSRTWVDNSKGCTLTVTLV